MPTSLTLISLNTWGGIGGINKLLTFFKDHADTDIFCLQEVWNGGEEEKADTAAGRDISGVDTQLLSKIQAALPDHTAYFQSNYVFYFGITIFVRNTLRVIAEGTTCIYREPQYVSTEDIADHGRIMQYVTLETVVGPLSIFNTHAAWQPGGKKDTPERLEQSERIISFTQRFSHPLILAGDFNLSLQTRSVALIEEAGWENLIRTYGITSTRTSAYDKLEKLADYVFVKNEVNVRAFRVLPEEVSDHAALFLQF